MKRNKEIMEKLHSMLEKQQKESKEKKEKHQFMKKLDFNSKVKTSIATELSCEKGIFFDDGIHKVYVTYEDFDKKNEELLNKTSIDELRGLMPTNPDWMNGAKAGVMLGEAIFRKANIKNIIPSDLNLINGVIKEE